MSYYDPFKVPSNINLNLLKVYKKLLSLQCRTYYFPDKKKKVFQFFNFMHTAVENFFTASETSNSNS